MKKKIFVLTDDMFFSFRIIKELKQRNIPFKILEKGNKIPDYKALILTTSEEIAKFKLDNNKFEILAYNREQDFKKFIVKLLAMYKIGYKDTYSELIFSIDPGTKHLGLVIFLDDYYLNSHTIFEKDRFIEIIRIYISTLQETNPNPLKVFFKLGRGIIPLILQLIEKLFKNFEKGSFRVFLIDESKTSKYKIRDENKKKLSKDEAAALIISLRNGFEITYENYKAVLSQKKTNRMKSEDFFNKSGRNNDEDDLKLVKIAEGILKGDVSLSKSMELLNTEGKFF